MVPFPQFFSEKNVLRPAGKSVQDFARHSCVFPTFSEFSDQFRHPRANAVASGRIRPSQLEFGTRRKQIRHFIADLADFRQNLQFLPKSTASAGRAGGPQYFGRRWSRGAGEPANARFRTEKTADQKKKVRESVRNSRTTRCGKFRQIPALHFFLSQTRSVAPTLPKVREKTDLPRNDFC